MSFIAELLSDIATNSKPQLIKCTSVDLPVEAYLGTLWMQSPAGSLIEFYTYIDPSYCHGPMYGVEEVHLTQVRFHTFARSDRVVLRKWEDFTLYDLNMYHQLIKKLQRSAFEIMIIS